MVGVPCGATTGATITILTASAQPISLRDDYPGAGSGLGRFIMDPVNYQFDPATNETGLVLPGNVGNIMFSETAVDLFADGTSFGAFPDGCERCWMRAPATQIVAQGVTVYYVGPKLNGPGSAAGIYTWHHDDTSTTFDANGFALDGCTRGNVRPTLTVTV